MRMELFLFPEDDGLQLFKFRFRPCLPGDDGEVIESEAERDFPKSSTGIAALICVLVHAKCYGIAQPYRGGPAKTLKNIVPRDPATVDKIAPWVRKLFGAHEETIAIRRLLRAGTRTVLRGGGKQFEPFVEFVATSWDPATNITVILGEEIVEQPTFLIDQLLDRWERLQEKGPSVPRAMQLDLSGRSVDGIVMLKGIRTKTKDDDPLGWIDASIALGTLIANTRVQDRAIVTLEETLRAIEALVGQAEPSRLAVQRACALYHLGIAHVRKPSFDRAREYLARVDAAIAEARRLLDEQEAAATDGVPPAIATHRTQMQCVEAGVVHQYGVIAREEGDLDLAVELFEQAIGMREHAGSNHRVAFDLRSLARVLAMRGQLDEARQLYDKAEEILRRHGALRYIKQIERDRAVYFDD